MWNYTAIGRFQLCSLLLVILLCVAWNLKTTNDFPVEKCRYYFNVPCTQGCAWYCHQMEIFQSSDWRRNRNRNFGAPLVCLSERKNWPPSESEKRKNEKKIFQTKNSFNEKICELQFEMRVARLTKHSIIPCDHWELNPQRPRPSGGLRTLPIKYMLKG